MISKTLDLDGPVRIVDYGGEGSLVLLLHGLAGSVGNWTAVGGDLADHGRVIAVDLLGCGETPPAGRGVSVEDNARLVEGLISELGASSATLVGNSMGGLVAMITAADSPSSVDRLVLVDTVLPIDRRSPPDPEVLIKLLSPLIPVFGPLGVRLYRATTTPRQAVDEALRMNCVDVDSIPEMAREAIVENAISRRADAWAIRAFIDADRSVAGYALRPSRLRRLMHRVSQPTLLIHGTEDRLVASGSARWAAAQRPDWDYVEIDGVGHLPMLEAPHAFVDVVSGWLSEP